MKGTKILCIVFILLSGVIFSCKKDDFTPPAVQTLSVTALSSTSFEVVGNIGKTGSEETLEYGFVYNSTQEVGENKGIKVSLGKDAKEGEFRKQIRVDSALSSNYYNTIWVRSYLRDAKGTVFGAMLNINLPSPSMGDITPKMAMSGDIIKIVGTFFDATINNTVVTIGNVRAKTVSVSSTEISAEVPSGIQASHGNSVNVSIKIGSTPAGNSSLQMLANYKDFSPKSGPVGSELKFTGDNLPDYYGSSNIQVEMGNQLINPTYYYSTINVPFTVKESSDLAITINGKKKVLGTFTVTPPVISELSPESVYPGQAILIRGTNFPTMSDGSEGRPLVKLGTGSYTDVSFSDRNTYHYTIPGNISEGDHSLYLKVGPHEVQAPRKLKIMGYSATSFAPKSGSSLQLINITGNFISGTWYTVYFGSIEAGGTATSATNLQVTVPYGMPEGNVKISIEFPNKRVTVPGDFEIVGPSFTSFNPTSAVPGTVLTIKGSGFVQNYDTVVKFGSIAVSPNSVSSNTILVTVPSNVSPGAMKLTVVTAGQSVTHKDNFTLLDK